MAKNTFRSLFAYRIAESIQQVLGGEMLQTDYQHLCDRNKVDIKFLKKTQQKLNSEKKRTILRN
jgi:hypothetical protein